MESSDPLVSSSYMQRSVLPCLTFSSLVLIQPHVSSPTFRWIRRLPKGAAVRDLWCCQQANNLESLEPLGLGRNPLLRELHLQENAGLVSPHQLFPLKAVKGLQDLRLCPGPMASTPHWRLPIVHDLPQLLQLDDAVITAEEQVGEKRPKYSPDPKVSMRS